MFQAPSYKILSQELSADENEFSSSLSSDGSQDSLDLVLIDSGNKRSSKRTVRRKRQQSARKMMGKIDGFESYEELIGSAKRKKQFMILGGLCVLAVVIIVAIVLSVMLINEKTDDNEKTAVDLDDILKGRLQPKRFNGTWIDDKSFYYFDEAGDFIIFDTATKSKRVVVGTSDPAFEKFISATSYEFSADGKYILLATQIVKLYRHSFLATWHYYDVDAKTIGNIVLNNDAEPAYRLAKFGPGGAEMIVVDRKINLHYLSSPAAEAIKITNDEPSPTSIKYNGVPDWVYEEEIFSSNSATWFSASGKQIAFIQFDDTHVRAIPLPLYGTPGLLKYPDIVSVQYPKAGAQNPTVKLFSVNLTDAGNLREIPTPADLGAEHLITSVAWANEDDLISVWTNRVQNFGLVYKCKSDVCENVLTLNTSDHGWIEFYTAPFFNKDGSEMIFIGSHNGYRHIKVLNLSTKAVANRTSGNFVVTEILKYNKEHDVIIYTANTESDIKAQHVYAIKNEVSAMPVCLTCDLFNDHSYYSVEVSEGGSHLIITASGPGVPRVDLYTLTVNESRIELSDHVEIENNNAMKDTLEGKKMPQKIYDKITFTDGSEAYVMMLLPSDLDETKKYPMLIEVYGGPDSSSVTNRFSIEWGTYLASSLNVVYVKIDGRGSGLRSDEHLHKLYKNLGTVEVEDQVRTAHKLHEKYTYLDAQHTGIWGWSYGGYVSGMSLMRDNDVFKCATSVAPVVDWELYDSIYTERYMLTPKLNPTAYNVSRMTNFVDNITKYNKQYMLVHGTLDDNVHFQQSMVLARVLERSDIQFKEITYPDEDHSLSGVRPHLYHSLERFFKQCFSSSQ